MKVAQAKVAQSAGVAAQEAGGERNYVVGNVAQGQTRNRSVLLESLEDGPAPPDE